MSDNNSVSKPTALQVVFDNKADLYASYMPFVKNGGLFIHTRKTFKLGDEVFLLLQLFEEVEQFPLNGKVVWYTPLGAQGGLPSGIGVELGEDAAAVRKKIETYLAGLSSTGRRTDTM